MNVKRDIVVFDLDGTLADITHRLEYLTHETPPHWDPTFDWKAFFRDFENDIPIPWTVDLAKNLKNKVGMHVAICTGRSEVVKEETIQWLRTIELPYEHLWMRARDDFRMDEAVKVDLLNPFKERIAFIVDDRRGVSRHLRLHGFHVLQCAEVDF